MPTSLTAHLNPAEPGQRSRAARRPIERFHLQIVWLLSQGRNECEVAALTGHGQRWITQIVRHDNAEGASGLGDQRARNRKAGPGAHRICHGVAYLSHGVVDTPVKSCSCGLISIIITADQRLARLARPRGDRDAGAEESVGTANVLA
jgi:hypothetical protein